MSPTPIVHSERGATDTFITSIYSNTKRYQINYLVLCMKRGGCDGVRSPVSTPELFGRSLERERTALRTEPNLSGAQIVSLRRAQIP